MLWGLGSQIQHPHRAEGVQRGNSLGKAKTRNREGLQLSDKAPRYCRGAIQ